MSFRQRDELAAAADKGGWSPVAARRVALAEQRFILSGATIAVVDARGAFQEGLEAVARLADAVEANAAALIALVSKTDIPRVEEMLRAGATHYLASPFGESEFLQALHFAERYTTRLGHSFSGGSTQPGPVGPRWRWHRDSDTVDLDAELQALLDIADEAPSSEAFFSSLGTAGAADARSAVIRLEESGSPTAFAHRLHDGDEERLVHHIMLEGGDIIGQVEQPDRDVQSKVRGRRDPLTGLGDAHLARQWIEQQLAEAAGERPRLVLILLGLQRYDRINSALGRAAGDAALAGMARRIEGVVGPMAGRKRLIARLAGAEFLVGLSAPTDVEEAHALAQRLTSSVEQPMLLGDRPVVVKTRCGIVADCGEDETVPDILRRASAALAEARGEGGETIRLYGAEAERTASHANRLEIDLAAALEKDEIEILFQPQVQIATNRITGVEALARWQHAELGALGADALLAAADRADQLVELSAHIQLKALAAAAAWSGPLAGLRVAVNVTAADMAQEGFDQALLARIDRSGFPRDRLTIEITESGLIADLEAAAGHIGALRQAGLQTAIDDFGTGYSSLAYLKSLPVDYLKLDRRLSQDIAGGPRDRVVVSGVIEMAKSLGLAVIAEGVETDAQLALIAEEGCEFYQGFLCSPPLAEAELLAFVNEWQS